MIPVPMLVLLICLSLALALIGCLPPLAARLAGPPRQGDPQEPLPLWGVLSACTFAASLGWLLLALASPYRVVAVRLLPVQIDALTLAAYVEGRKQPVDVWRTFGQRLQAGDLVEETELDPSVLGIEFELPSTLLYEPVVATR